MSIISFLVIYMLMLIPDLDDPFEYEDSQPMGEEASLQPLMDLNGRVQTRLSKLVKQP